MCYISRISSIFQKKVDKRGRKLVDYDSQRHNFQSLQCNPKKRDELKVSRGKELLEEAKRTYEQLNSELHDELPALYDSRVLFLVTNLQTLFAAEQVFHTESAKVSKWGSVTRTGSFKHFFNKDFQAKFSIIEFSILTDF